MPRIDGFGLLGWAQQHQPELDVYVLSMHTELAYVQRAMDLGAKGFLAKEDAQSELLNAVAQVSELFYTSESIGREVHEYLQPPKNEMLSNALTKVSKAEKKVLDLLTGSCTSREIAETLSLSVRTVEAHRSSLAEKLGARGPNKLLELAIKNRLLILDS
jgi:DNA-binding NarL/FixJ family response regulator